MGINNSQKNKTITGLRGFQGIKLLRKIADNTYLLLDQMIW